MKKFKNKKTGEIFNIVTPSLISDYDANPNFIEVIKDSQKVEMKEGKIKLKEEK